MLRTVSLDLSLAVERAWINATRKVRDGILSSTVHSASALALDELQPAPSMPRPLLPQGIGKQLIGQLQYGAARGEVCEDVQYENEMLTDCEVQPGESG